jgi:hypothetical protein
VKTLESRIHHQAWLRSLALMSDADQARAAGWWTPERERQLVAEAEAERDRRRAIAHAQELANLRNPQPLLFHQDAFAFVWGRAGNKSITGQIRRVK